MHALVADSLDLLAEDNPDGFDLGVVAFAVEVLRPDAENTWLRREEGGYTPAMDIDYYWAYFCSDHRWWVRKAVFAEADNYYRYPPALDESSGDDEEDSEE
jgi:hypothetical protein